MATLTRSGVRRALLLALSLGAAAGATAGPAEYLKIRRLLGLAQYEAALTEAVREAQAEPRSYRTLEALVEAGEGAAATDRVTGALERLSAQDASNPYPDYALGLLHQHAKDYAGAMASFHRAVARDPDFALPYREIAYTHRLLGTLDAAERELEVRLEEDPENAAAHYGLGFVHAFRGDTKTALAHLDRALAKAPDLRDAYRYASQLRFRAGDFEEARRLSHDLGLLANDDPLLEAAAQNGEAAASLRLAAYDDAVSCFQKALSRQRELGDRQGTWSSLDGMAVAYDNLGLHEKARAQHREALTAAEPLPNRAWTATTLANIGTTYAGERDFARARAYYFQALTIERALGDRRAQAYTLRDVGVSYLREGDAARARPYLEEAAAAAAAVSDALLHAVIENALAESHELLGALDEARQGYEQARDEAARIGYAEVVWRAERGLGAVSAAQDRWPEGEAHYARAVETIEGVRKSLHDADQRMAFLQEKMAAYEGAVALLYRMHVRAPAEGHERRALEYAERAKARTFLDLLAGARAGLAEERRPEPVSASDIAAGLQPGERLLEFMIGDQGSFAWLVSDRSVRMTALPKRAVLERKIERYRALLAQPPTRAEIVTDAARLGHELCATLLGPFLSEIAADARLTIVPDGALYFVPFETLVLRLAADGRPHYLIESHDVTYTPSASVLAGLNRHPPQAPPPLDLLAYGDPAPGSAPAGTSRTRSLERLVHARREVETIARLFSADRCRIRLGSEASERALKREDLSQFRIVHLATHGLTDARVPARSGLLLAPGSTDEDGVLQAVEVLDLDLRADLVALSACGSGLGRLVRGEGLVGVTRSFLHAGARRVLVSLWNVDDASTADLMKTFYGRWRQGAAPARALREAKLEMARSDRPALRFPYYWASFVLQGATAPD